MYPEAGKDHTLRLAKIIRSEAACGSWYFMAASSSWCALLSYALHYYNARFNQSDIHDAMFFVLWVPFVYLCINHPATTTGSLE